MQFEKRNFMGIELDVLTRHPEHDLIFFGVQVASSAGLKDASGSVMAYRQSKEGKKAPKLTLGGLLEESSISVPEDAQGRKLRSTMAMLNEAQAYQMLLRGNAPQSEPFRKWVTEEVLPAIRKTGKYDAEKSTNPIARGVMDELKTLRGEVGELKGLLETLMERSQVVDSAPKASVYLDAEVHTERVWRHFDRSLLIKLCEMRNLSAPVADKLKGSVMLNLEVAMVSQWNATDPRKLHTELSKLNKRPWSLFPLSFLKKHMNQDAYAVALEKALNERLLK